MVSFGGEVLPKQTNVYLDDATKREVQILIIETGKWKSLSDFMREAAREKLEREKKKK